MKTAIYILLIALIPQLSWAQNGKLGEVKNRAERKAENRLDRKIDQGIDNGLNKIETLFKKKNKNNNSNSNTNSNNNSNSNSNNNSNSSANKGNTTGGGIGLFGKQKEVTLLKSYDFVSDMTMDIKSYKKDPEKADVQSVQYLFPKSGNAYIGCSIELEEQGKKSKESGAVMSIIEPEHMITFLTTNGDKYYNVIDFSKIAEDTDDEEIPEITKTGKTKKILSYSCEEYIMEDEDIKVNYWVTQELDEMGEHMQNVFQAMAQQMSKKRQKDNSWMQVKNGMALEIVVYDKKSKETNHSIATEVNEKKESSFATDGYQALSVGNMMNNSGN